MRATISGFDVEDRCVPALDTRREYADGSVGYDAVYDVRLRIRIVGNDSDVSKFLGDVKVGTRLREIQVGAPSSKLRKKLTGVSNGRKYVFD
jgi:hypothetical protein